MDENSTWQEGSRLLFLNLCFNSDFTSWLGHHILSCMNGSTLLYDTVKLFAVVRLTSQKHLYATDIFILFIID